MTEIRLAKADESDFNSTFEFLQTCEALFYNGWACSSGEQWQDWDDDNIYKIEIVRLRKEIALREKCDEDDIDNRTLLFEFLAQKYRGCDCHWRRVIMAAEILIDKVCDPMQDIVEWHPFIERALDDAILGE